jgi:acyl dehydratase
MDTTKVPLGATYGPIESYCDPGEIAAFGLAINDDNPMYQDGRAVPPTYALVSGLDPFFGVMEIPLEATEGGNAAGHGEHDLYIHSIPKPGTVLRTTSEVSSVVVNKVGMNIFSRLTHVDEAGNLVYEQFWSTIHVGPVIGGNQGRLIPDHTFPAAARSRRIGTMVLGTTADQTFRYAGASGDRSLPHVSDRVGQDRSGKRGKIMQGACTLGIATRALVAMAAGGDPNRIRRVAVRFSRYAFPGDEITVSVYALDRQPNGRDAYAFEAISNGDYVLRNGLVEVDPIPDLA